MKEDLLHFIWRTKRFDQSNMLTTAGESVQIIAFGHYNTHAGPDFLNAKLYVDTTLWAGNVEMHLKSSDWQQHGHEEDKSYDEAVILHVVWEEDRTILRKNGEKIPCLELKNRISSHLVATYKELLANENWIPCQKLFPQVSDFNKEMWLERLTIERLERKSAAIHALLEATKNNWEETFYRFLARNFGSKVNNEPFELLAQSLPMLILAKHKNSQLQIEALIFGQAGLLEEDFSDDYPLSLQKEYRFLQKKYSLLSLNKEIWKFLRLRPANFPTVRLAQFAALIYQSVHLFSKILESSDVQAVKKLLQSSPSEYWRTHYLFDKNSKELSKKLGAEAINSLIINTIVPFIFLYGKIKKEQDLQDKAINCLESLPPEKNNIIEEWHALGIKTAHAGRTQALLQLKNEYCDSRRCLECMVGTEILRSHK